jgi:hypothetical protein
MFFRLPAVVLLFGASALLFSAGGGAPVKAVDKKEEAALKKEVTQLQNQVNQLQTANTTAQNTQKTLQSTIDGYKSAGLIHVVILKAKPDTKPDTSTKSGTDAKADPQQKFLDDAYSQLAKIKGVRGFWAGKPSTKASGSSTSSTAVSSTDTTATSSSSGSSSTDGPDYTLALVVVFDDATALKTYLSDPAHTKFTDKYLKNYETPLVFDIEPRKPQP